ncbi:MAG TPA: hypothetical protein VHB46_09500 [Burkholderiales bacterium]|nr:hypothetical protein [Burkholderiales bacterium]
MKSVRGIFVCVLHGLAVVAAIASGAIAHAQVASTDGADASPKPAPPAFGSMRVEIYNDYEHPQSGGTIDYLVPRIDFSASPDLSFRIETPIVFADPDAPGSNRESGMGDLLFRGSYRVMRGPGYAIVAGGELILNTASKDSLGMGKDVIAPLVFASIDVPRCNSVVFPFLQYFTTIGGDDARTDVRYTSLKAPFLTRWPNLVYTILEPQMVVDHTRSDKVGMTFEGEIGKFLDRDVAVWGRPGLGLFGDNLPQVYNWKFEVGVRYFLR